MRYSIFKNKVSASLIAIFCSILWGSAFPVLKTSFKLLQIGPEDIYRKIYFAGMRFFIASIILFLLMRFVLKIDLRLSIKEIPLVLLLGIMQTSLQYYFFYIGLGNTTGIKASILTASGTFFTIIFAHFIYHNDKMNTKKVIGIVSGILGIIIINIQQLPLELSFQYNGEGYLIIAGLVATFATFLAKKLSKDINPFKVTAYQLLMGSTLLLVVGKNNNLNFTLQSSALLVYAAFISSIGFGLWYTLLKFNKAGEITLFKFVIPIAGTVLSTLFLPEEMFSINIIIALVLVSIGIIFVNINGRRI
jgi:drug/metabolite transporter (DMT)-like permease